jgi:mRNA-degrading endonuclease RelE of RelBE toxin-antitoxin system
MKHLYPTLINYLSVFVISQCVIINFALAQTPNSQTNIYYTVEGTLTQSSQYCGGVHPSHEEEAEYRRAKPYYSKLYVRKGKVNSTKAPIIDSTNTDANGHYSFKLPPGDYVIIMPSQKNKNIIHSLKKGKSKTLRVNSLCLRGWWKGGLYKINVKDKNIPDLDHNFHNRCFIPYPIPCFDYIGPYPA